MAETSADTSELHSVNDLFLLRIEQAKLLQDRVVGSCCSIRLHTTPDMPSVRFWADLIEEV